MVTPSEMNDAIQTAKALAATNGQAHIIVLDDDEFEGPRLIVLDLPAFEGCLRANTTYVARFDPP